MVLDRQTELICQVRRAAVGNDDATLFDELLQL